MEYTQSIAYAANNFGRLILLMTVLVVISAVRCFAQEKPLNERATSAAWDALTSEKFDDAIKNADKCIDEFRGAARRLQERLEKEKVELPTGKVAEEQKQKIFANGLLNDVGTCYFIKGKAAEKLGRKEDAKLAYEAAVKLSYARTWDPSGWFWSPAESASDRLDALR